MKTTDIVIPLNDDGSGNKNFEIRYALRSIAENLYNYRDIIIVTAKVPHFIKGVTNIKQHDGNNKAITLFDKRMAGAELSNADNIVLWSDDQVLLQETNALSLPTLRRGLELMSDNTENNPWGQILRNTAKLLEWENKTCFDCESHSPNLLNRKKFIELGKIFYDEIHANPGVVTGSLYHNYYLSVMFEMDLFKTTFDGKTCAKKRTTLDFGAKMFLGYDNIGLKNGIEHFLMDKFKYKCKYEV